MHNCSELLQFLIIFSDMPCKLKYPSDISIYAKISPTCTYVSGSRSSIDKFITMAQEKGFQTFEVESSGIDTAGILRSSGVESKLMGNFKKVIKFDKFFCKFRKNFGKIFNNFKKIEILKKIWYKFEENLKTLF